MKTFQDKVICPRCDGNGLIYKAKVEDSDIYICDECEAAYLSIEDLSNGEFQDLSTFLEGNGYSYRETKIIDLGYDWYKE